jgi:hypothetical protein
MDEDTEQNNGEAFGRIVSRKKSCPGIEVDCSEWSPLLEIKLTPATELTPESQRTMVKALLDGIDNLDRGNQGSGFRCMEAWIQGTDVKIRLAPIDPQNAKERIAAICAALTQNVDNPIPGIARLQACAA